MQRYDAIYARQSIDKKDSLSIESQIEECEKRATNGIKKYVDRRSGKDTNRPDLKRLIDDIKQNRIEKVIVYKLDRLSRNVKDFYEIYTLLTENNTEFIAIHDNLDTTSSAGRAMMGILAVFAQMERENTSDRVKTNYYHRISTNGSWPGGPAPYGMKLVTNSQNQKSLEKDENTYKAIEYIFSRYREPGISLGKLAKELTNKGFLGKKREEFDNIAISRLLHNSLFVKADKLLLNYFKSENVEILSAEDKWDGIHSAHIVSKKPAINANKRQRKPLNECYVYVTNFEGFINSQDYIEVQEKLKHNKQIRNSGQGQMGWLGGLCKCSLCGATLKIYNSNTKLLACRRRYVSKGCIASYDRYINLDFVMERVEISIQQELDIWESYSKGIEDKNAAIDNAIEKKEKEIENLIVLEFSGEVGKKKLEDRVNIIDKEINILKMQKEYNPPNIGPIKFAEQSEEVKNAIAHQIISKVIVSPDGNVEIMWSRDNNQIEVNEDFYMKALIEIQGKN